MDQILKSPITGHARTAKTVQTPVLLALATLPVMLAIATWDPAQTGRAMQNVTAYLHLPVLAVEFIVVLVARHFGFNPFLSVWRWPIWARAMLLALIGIATGSGLFLAPMPVAAFIPTLCMLLHLLFGLALFDLATRWDIAPEQHRRFWLWVAGASTGYVLILALLVSSIPDPDSFDWGHLGLAVVNVRQIGFYCIVGACAALGYAAIAQNRLSYWGGVAMASVMIGADIWSGTRGALVAILGAFMLGAAMLPALRSVRSIVALLISGGLGTGLSFVHHAPHPFYGLARILGTAVASSADEAGSGRVTMWLATLREIAVSPVFGHGAGQFRIIVPEAAGVMNSPHNAILQIAFQWGIVGAICFFGLFCAPWLRFMRRAWGGPDVLVPAFLVATALLIFSLYDVVAYYPYPIVMIATGIVLVLTLKRQAPITESSA